MSIRISLAMIVKNEEQLLGRALACVRSFVDEIVIVDTGSTDRTIEIARSFGARVYTMPWPGHFAVARNAAFDHATGDWTMWLDADDVLSESSQQAILRLKRDGIPDGIDVIEATYESYYDAMGRCIAAMRRERLIRRGTPGLRWQNPLHECIPHRPEQTLFVPDLIIEHREDPAKRAGKTGRYKALLESYIDRPADFPMASFYYANELFNERDLPRALEHYERFLAQGVEPSVTYETLVQIATCRRELGLHEEALRAAEQAYAVDPTRAEAFVRRAFYHFDRSEWAAALPLFEAASALPRPDLGYAQDRDHTWLPLDYASICHFHLGDPLRAAECSLRALAFGTEVERIKGNLRTFIEKL